MTSEELRVRLDDADQRHQAGKLSPALSLDREGVAALRALLAVAEAADEYSKLANRYQNALRGLEGDVDLVRLGKGWWAAHVTLREALHKAGTTG